MGIVIVLSVLYYIGHQPRPTGGGASAPTPAPTTPRPLAAATTLLNLQGSGIKRSAKFTAGGDWTIGYAYDCTSFGTSGNFIITVYDDAGGYADSAANEIGAKGSGTNPEYGGGTFYLEMNSECDWSVKVTG